jgi:hypothetical protein
LFGIAAAALSLGAVDSYALPANSPYAIWEPQSVDSGAAPMSEGRSAYAPGESGETFMAPRISTPEDTTYYSRGK